MLYVDTNIKDYYDEVLRFSFKIGKSENLLERLMRIGYAYHNNGKQYVCFLYKDFAPYSFSWACYDLKDCEITLDNGETIITRKYESECWMNGGLIYHGTHDNGGDGGAPTFSVNLNPSDGWSIHT